MPRTWTRPQTGTPVWYYAAAPPAAAALHAIVVALNTGAGSGVGSPPQTFDLTVYDPAAAAGAGAWSKVTNVPFHYGTRPTSGAWCTMPRINTPAVGAWPSAMEGPLEFALHDVPEDKRQEVIDKMREEAEAVAKAQEETAPKQLEHVEEEGNDEPHGRRGRRR